jgi:hypothetical protein
MPDGHVARSTQVLAIQASNMTFQMHYLFRYGTAAAGRPADQPARQHHGVGFRLELASR